MSARKMVPGSIKITEPILVTNEKNKYRPHEFPKLSQDMALLCIVDHKRYDLQPRIPNRKYREAGQLGPWLNVIMYVFLSSLRN